MEMEYIHVVVLVTHLVATVIQTLNCFLNSCISFNEGMSCQEQVFLPVNMHALFSPILHAPVCVVYLPEALTGASDCLLPPRGSRGVFCGTW